MLVRLLTLGTALAMIGCTTTATTRDEPVIEPEPEIVVIEEDPVPDACELLLNRLDETHPLLANIDSSLEAQSARIDAAIEELQRPVPVARIQDCPTVSIGPLGNKEIIGAIEWLYMDPPGRHFRARVDSGAETSSLSASEVVEFERDGEDWVRFNFRHDPKDELIAMELPIKRTVLIRQASSIEAERRVVIELDIRLGNALQATEFTLTDRSRMTYPVLLGRAFLMDIYVVDVSKSYTHERYEGP